MVADERIEQVGVAVQQDPSERDELAVTGVGRRSAGSVRVAEVAGEDGGSNEERHVRGLRPGAFVRGERDHLGLGVPVTGDESEENGVEVLGHVLRVRAGADEALTAADGPWQTGWAPVDAGQAAEVSLG